MLPREKSAVFFYPRFQKKVILYRKENTRPTLFKVKWEVNHAEVKRAQF